jgi:hypothetical protein
MEKILLVGVLEMTFFPAIYSMNRLLTQLLLLVSVLAFTIKASADDRWETLRAINWVENPTNHTRMGRFGELGPYQFRPATWRMHTRKPFQLAIQREAADEVAVIHYEWIKTRLEAAGVDANAFNIAMAWNTGVENVINRRAPSVSHNYAERVVNLVNTFHQRALAAADAAESTRAATAVAAIVSLPPPSLDKPHFHFSVMPDAPKFEIVLAPPPPAPTIFTSHEPVPAKPLFVVSTTATLTPQFNLLSSLSN